MPTRLSIARRRFRLGWWPALSVAGVILLLVVLASVADAALWVRISVDPAHPVAEVPARVRVQTLLVTGANCLDDPHASATPIVAFNTAGALRLETMELRATGPRAADVLPVTVKRRADDPTTWEGSVVFPRAGTWLLRMAGPSWRGAPGACSGAEVKIQVLPRTWAPSWWA